MQLSAPLFLSHRHCHTRPASADESPLIDSPLLPKTDLA
jgi:hypothetical protein